MGVKVDAGKIFHTSFEGIEKTMHLKGQHKQQQEPTSNLKKSGRITHQRTVVKSQRMESKDLHNRDLAESTLDSAQSLSLGLSSQLLRIPFASPGGMNIRHHSKETVRHNDDSHFTSPGTNMRKSYSHIQAVDGSYMLPTDSSDVRLTLSETQPRALFDMSHSTITPYLRSFSLNDSAALYPMSEHRPPLAAAANTHRNSIDSSIQDGQAGIHTAMRGAADLPPSHDDYNKPARRVSFGPTARLSFSSMGALDTEPPVQLNSAAPQTTSDDFYPQKVHRIGTSGSNFNQASLLVSPIPTSHSPSAVHTAELTRIKEGDFEDRDDSTASRSHNKIEETVKKVRPDISKPNFEPDVTNKLSNEAWKEFFALMTIFASAYQLAQLYHGQECVRRLKELPAAHFYSGFVYHQLGRAYLEMGDYKAALAALKEMLRLEPHRVKGTEILSTVLWHLKKEKDLCSLAQQVRITNYKQSIHDQVE